MDASGKNEGRENNTVIPRLTIPRYNVIACRANRVEKGEKKSAVSLQTELSYSTISTIVSQFKKIKTSVENNNVTTCLRPHDRSENFYGIYNSNILKLLKFIFKKKKKIFDRSFCRSRTFFYYFFEKEN